jgi:hypothetical protein
LDLGKGKPLKGKATRIWSVALAAVAFTAIAAGPAAAADKTVLVYLPGQSAQEWAGRGSWDDSDDTLCVIVGDHQSHIKAVARIAPVSGTGPVFSVTDRYPQSGFCTDNLRIPEDRLYRMTVKVTQWNGDTYAVSSRFYT